jgi:predicted dinucleotide-binding enzyme
MKIAIVGVGAVGSYYAEHWQRAGHELILSYYRDQAKLEAFAANLGKNVSWASPAEAVKAAELILFCPRFEHIDDAAAKMGDIQNKILIDANNPFNPERTGLAQLPPEQSAASLVAALFPNARHVKALHNLGIQTILEHKPRQLVGFVAGDDAEAVRIVMALLREAGLDPLATGAFSTARLSEFPGSLFGLAFSRAEAEAALSALSG